MTKRALPNMFSKYKLALLLFKLFNNDMPNDEWLQLNINQRMTTRQTHFITAKDNLIVGLNNLNNRLHCLHGKIPVDWLNLTFEANKIESKKNLHLYNII
jgi:hypothetical protein